MNAESDVPTLAEIWDFLVGFKQATESSFQRVESRLDGVESRVSGVETQLADVKSDINRVERRLVRIDDRLSGFEDLSIRPRLDDHERRIVLLEQRFL